jgi:hypothetical protein
MENSFRWMGHRVPTDTTYVFRRSLVQEIVGRFRQGQYLQLVGPHQCGRTTAAVQVATYLAEHQSENLIPVVISCTGLPGLDLTGFADMVVTRLDEVAREFLSGSAYKTFSKNLNVARTDRLFDLQKALLRAGDAVKGHALVLIFDELETLADEAVCDALTFLRGLYEHYGDQRLEAPYRVMILVTRDLQRWKLGNRSPFNISEAVMVPPFTREEFDEMLDEKHAGAVLKDVTFTDDARQMIYAESGGRPYFLQRICHEMVEEMISKAPPWTLTHKETVSAFLRIFEGKDENLKGLNHEIPDDSQEWSLCRKLACGMRLPYRGVQTEFDRLEELGVIAKQGGFCEIPVNLYRRRIINRCYNEAYADLEYYRFDDRDQLLLTFSIIQVILLSFHVRERIVETIPDIEETGWHDTPKSERLVRILKVLDGLFEESVIGIDMEEANAFLEYYKEPPLENDRPIRELAARWFDLVLPKEFEQRHSRPAGHDIRFPS